MPIARPRSCCCSLQASSDRETTCQSAPSICPSPIFTNASWWTGSARRVSSGQRAASASASSGGTGWHHSIGPSLSSLISPQKIQKNAPARPWIRGSW